MLSPRGHSLAEEAVSQRVYHDPKQRAIGSLCQEIFRGANLLEPLSFLHECWLREQIDQTCGQKANPKAFERLLRCSRFAERRVPREPIEMRGYQKTHTSIDLWTVD